MTDAFQRRLMGEMKMLERGKDELAAAGIHFWFDQTNMHHAKVLIVPKHKESGGLVSPYTHGFFVFDIVLPSSYPFKPPKVQFHPTNSTYRLHPNYYMNGKVCLSMINTWGGKDWSPASTLRTLMLTLEERFNERALCCEPGYERAPVQDHRKYNSIVQVGVYDVAICGVVSRLKSDSCESHAEFKDLIMAYAQTNKAHIAKAWGSYERNFGRGKNPYATNIAAIGDTCEVVPNRIAAL